MALGRLQIQMLSTMSRHPLGGWPVRWRLNHRDSTMMRGLAEKGYVRSQPGNTTIAWVITERGHCVIDAQPKPKPVRRSTT